MKCFVLALAAIVGLSAVSAAEDAGPPARTDLLRALARGADGSGSDGGEGSWIWRKSTHTLELFDAAGANVRRLRLPQAATVDYHALWGVAAVTHSGGVAAGSSPEDLRDLDLGGVGAGEVAWVGPDRIAFTPTAAPYLVGVVELAASRLVGRWGRGREVGTGAGFHLLRHVMLRRDAARERLWTLDTTIGSIRVFGLADGKELARFELGDGEVPVGLRDWALGLDRERRAVGARDEATVDHWGAITITPNGDAVVVTECADGGNAGVLRVLALGQDRPVQHRLSGGCCWSQALHVTSKILMYPNPGTPGEKCVGTWAPGPEAVPGAASLAGSSASGEATGAGSSLQRWAVGAPLASRSFEPIEVPEVAEELPVPEVLRPAIVCVGGLVITCRRVGEGDPSMPITPEPRGTIVRGQVFLGAEPVEAAVRLSLEDIETRRPVYVPFGLDSAGKPILARITDHDGTFELPPIAPGSYALELSLGSVTEPGPRIDVVPPRMLAEGAFAVHDLGQIRLEPGLSLHVFVADENGRGVPRAVVGGLQGMLSRSPSQRAAVAAADGWAVLTHLDPRESIQISCQAEGFAHGNVEAFATDGEARCLLSRLGKVVARIVDEEGEGIPGVQATALGTDGFTTTAAGDADGTVEILGLPGGEYRFRFGAAGYAGRTIGLKLAAGARRSLGEIELQPARQSLGVVLDAAGDEPVLARVRLLEPPSNVEATTDDEGRFEIPTPDSGEIELLVVADGFPNQRVSAQLPEDPAEWIELRLVRGGRLRVLVWERGEPCAGCVVWTTPSIGVPLHTDTSGTVETTEIAAGRYWVSRPQVAQHGELTVVSGAGEGKEAIVKAGLTTTVELGEGLQEIVLVLDQALPDGWTLVAAGDDGAVSVSDAGDGSWLMRRKPSDNVVLSLGRRGVGPMSPVVDIALVAADEPRHTLVIPVPTGAAGGSFAPNDEATGWLELSHLELPHLEATARIEADGSVWIPYLAPGTWRVQSPHGTAIVTIGADPVSLPADDLATPDRPDD